MTVRCRTCHRVEVWAEGRREVVMPGGARRAAVPGRSALAALTASWRGELGPVVGTCPGCGQPLISDDPAPGADYPVALPAGDLWFRADLRIDGPDGALTLEEAAARIDRALPRVADAPAPGFGPFQGVLLMMMMAPVVVWVFSVWFVAVFLYRFHLPSPTP